MGLGKGKGEDQTTNVVAGSCCAICCGVCFLVIGLPMLIAGVVLIQLYKGEHPYGNIFDDTDLNYLNQGNDQEVRDIFYKVGIGMIVVSVLCVVIGVVMVILICTGCCGNSQRAPSTGTVIAPNQQTQHTVQTTPYAAQQGYYPNQPGQQYAQQPYMGGPPQQQYMAQQQYPQKI